MIPLPDIVAAAIAGTARDASAFKLSRGGLVYLGFEMRPTDTDLTVHVERAEGLQGQGGFSFSADPYCVICIAEVAAFGQPTSFLQHRSLRDITPPAEGDKSNPVWNHEMLLELPGAELDGSVAMRPNWFIHVEAMATDQYLREDVRHVPVLHAMMPLTEVLSDLAANERPKTEPSAIDSQINALRWSPYNSPTNSAPRCEFI